VTTPDDAIGGAPDAIRAPVNRHRLIVRHRSRDGVIAIDESAGDALPRIDTDDRHTADVDHVNVAIEAKYGLRATVLRSLLHGEVRDGIVERAHEVEVHGGVAETALAWRAAATVELPDAADRAALDAWRAPFSIVDGRDWMAPGWFERALDWIDSTMRAAGLGAPSRVRQIRTWASSCVLEVECAGAIAYFKAVANAGGSEHAVTRFLAASFPNDVPRLIAHDARGRWLLLEACAGRNLERVADVAMWADAARRYGELQAACVGRVAELERIGCKRRPLDALPAAVAALANDERTLRAGTPDGSTHAELAQLRALVPHLAERCRSLAACGVPDSLEHGDLWPSNIFVAGNVVDGGASVIIDWEDVRLAHPFLSLAPLTVGLSNAGLASAANVERLERAYLSAFAAIAPAEALSRALALAAPLCFLDLAVRYRAERASVARLHPWMRDLVPHAVRLALARL